MTISSKILRPLVLIVAPLAALMVYGCGGGGGGGGSSSGGGTGGGSSSSSSASQSSYVASSPITVSTRSGVFRTETAVTGLSGGGYAVAWTERTVVAGSPDTSGSAILYRVISNTGATLTTELTANTTTAGDQEKPVLLGLSGGGFVAAWADRGATAPVVRAQLFDANGVKQGSELRVNTRALSSSTVGTDTRVQLVSAGTGFMVAFRERAVNNTQVTTADEVRAQIFTATGATVGSELTLKGFPTGSIGGNVPAYTLIGLTDGTFALSYEEANNTLGLMQGKVQLYTAAGAASGNPIALNGGLEAMLPALVSLNSGRFAAIWSQRTTVQSLRAQAYSGAGAAYGTAATVNANAALSASYYGATGLSNGGYAVVYGYNSGLTGQLMSDDGTKLFTEFEITTATSFNGVNLGSGPNGFAVVWTEPNARNTDQPVILRIYNRQ